MTDNADHRFDFGDAIQRRKRLVAEASVLVAAHAGDARVERLAALCSEATERLRAIPRPMLEHQDRLAMMVAAERDVVAELKRVAPLLETVPAAVDEEAPL